MKIYLPRKPDPAIQILLIAVYLLNFCTLFPVLSEGHGFVSSHLSVSVHTGYMALLKGQELICFISSRSSLRTGSTAHAQPGLALDQVLKHSGLLFLKPVRSTLFLVCRSSDNEVCLLMYKRPFEQRNATICFQSSMVTLYGRDYIGDITDTWRLSS